MNTKFIVCLLLCLWMAHAADDTTKKTDTTKPVAIDWNKDGIVDAWGWDWNRDGFVDWAAPVASWGAPVWTDRVVEPFVAAPAAVGWTPPTAWGAHEWHDGETISVREIPAGEYADTEWATVQTLGPVAEPPVQPNYVDVPVTLPTVHVGDMPAVAPAVVEPWVAGPVAEPWGAHFVGEPWGAHYAGAPLWV